MIGVAIALGVCLDTLLGEPKRFHPLVGFGRLASRLEKRLNNQENTGLNRCSGIVAVCVMVIPFPWGIWLLIDSLRAQASLLNDICILVINAVVVYGAIGQKSLKEHILPIADALSSGDRELARRLTSRVVSRDPATMNIEVSATESALENGSDAIFGALFWAVLAGAPGAIVYRLVNTLDAMWGYKTDRFQTFGWCAARLDDALNYIPARLTALSYMLLAPQPSRAWRCWMQQAHLHASPNGGPVMSAGAGALGVQLGGPTCYHGHWVDKPFLGEGASPNAADIKRAIQLVTKTTGLWVVFIVMVDLLGLLLNGIPFSSALLGLLKC